MYWFIMKYMKFWYTTILPQKNVKIGCLIVLIRDVILLRPCKI